MSNIYEKTLDKIANGIFKGFWFLCDLSKKRLWLASFLSALYIIALVVGAIIGVALLVVSVVCGFFGLLCLIKMIAMSILYLYQLMGVLFFLISLFCFIVLVTTLCMKKMLKSNKDSLEEK